MIDYFLKLIWRIEKSVQARFLRRWQRWYWTKKIMLTCKNYTGKPLVNFKSTVSPNTVLGKNVNFNGMTVKGKGLVQFGDNFHSGKNCLVLTTFHNYEGSKIPYDHTTITKDVTIEDNVWFGDNVTVLGGVTIGEGAIIQTGSVVVKNIPAYSIAGGHPAVVFKQRDIAHYELLKTQGKFH
jgi:acetyltransferase-like isoleucine patch superfamily enzyme